jgi:GLPGLI family protein
MKHVFIIVLLACTIRLDAQTNFYQAVKIEFEKTVYVRQLTKALQPEWYERIKDRLPETALTYYNFMGDTARSIYRTGREVPRDPKLTYQSFAENNVVYNDYISGSTISQKPVFEETFLVQDSLAKIKWKITPDVRTIAGFECHKAIGLLEDSITLFAFYADEILVRGGPESAHGLPGMILGLGIPRLHTTWFATKVEINGIDMNRVRPETKGKKTTRKAMIQSLDKVLKNFGAVSKGMVWQYII